MALTPRLFPEDRPAFAALAEAEGLSKQEAKLRAIREAASRRVGEEPARA